MKKIYTKENINKNLSVLKRRFNNICNREFSNKQIIYAFNKLKGEYQDLLLKPEKDENDKLVLTKVDDYIKRYLLNSNNIPDDIKLEIKNIHEEETKKKEDFDKEDIEASFGKKYVKPEEKKVIEFKPKIIDNEEKVKETVVTRKLTKEEKDARRRSLIHKRILELTMQEYINARSMIDIESIVDEIDMDEEKKFVILYKYDDNSVKTDDEVAKELNKTVEEVDSIVDEFLDKTIESKKSLVRKLERK